MKRIFLLTLAVFSLALVRAQLAGPTAADQRPAEVLQIKELEHDFGKIPQGKPVYYFFDISNTGLVPLKLDNVQASCGCTTPEWNKDAIPAGGSDKIKIGYNAANEGAFEKTITITYNGSQTRQIRIKGAVWKSPEGSAPANQSVQFLKQQIQ